MKPKAALFNLWEKGYPILKSFADRNPDFLILVPYGGYVTFPYFESFKDRIVPYEGLLSHEERLSLAAGAQEKARFLEKFPHDPTSRSIWSDFCQDMPDSPEAVAGALFGKVGEHLFEQMAQIETLEKLLERLDIRIVVVNEEFTLLPKSMAVWTKTRNIPLVHICHSPTTYCWYTVHDKLLSDAMVAYGSIEIDALMAIGFGDRIQICGNPEWQLYARYLAHKSAIRAEILARHFRNSDAPLVVFGTSFISGLTAMDDPAGPTNSGKAFFRALAGLKRQGHRLNCVIKLRSNNDESFEAHYVDLAAREGLQPGDFVFFRQDLVKLMLGADIVVSESSTLSIDALLCDTLAINVYTEESWWRGPYYPSYTGILECGWEGLEACLREALGNEALRKRLAEMRIRSRTAFQAAKPDEEPATAIAELITKMSFPPDSDHDGGLSAGAPSPEELSKDRDLRASLRKSAPGRTSVVIRKGAGIQALQSMVERLSNLGGPGCEIICLLSSTQIQAARACLPAGVILLQVDGSPHSRENLRLVSTIVTGEFVAYLDAHVRLPEGWERLLSGHLAGRSAVGPLADQIAGTQSVYHYLPMHRIDPDNVDSVSREVRMRYPGLALSADWLYEHVLVFRTSLLAEMADLPDEDSESTFPSLRLKIRRVGAKLLVAKDVYASVER